MNKKNIVLGSIWSSLSISSRFLLHY